MRKSDYQPLGKYIEQVDLRNRDLRELPLLGVSVEKKLIQSVANTNGTDMSSYKILKKSEFVYIADTSRRGDKIAFALNNTDNDVICSSAYTTFRIKDTTQLLPEYLMMWAKRPEFDRYARYMSHGSVRELFSWEEMCNVMLPVPPIEEQRRIVSEYQTVERRITNNEALIQKLEETAQAIYHHTFVEGIDEENLPEGWRKGCLEDISESISAGTIPVYHESEYLVLGQKCNNNHKIDLSLCKTHIPKVSVTFLKKGDTLINSTGNGTLGRVATVLFHPVNLAYDSNMTMVRPLEKKYSCYISCLLKTKEKYFIELSQGSTNQTRLYCSMIRPLSVLIPTDFVLEEFETRISMLYDYTYYLQQENTHLRTLLSLLTSKLS